MMRRLIRTRHRQTARARAAWPSAVAAVLLLLAGPGTTAGSARSGAGPAAVSPWSDPHQPPARRAAELLAAMTPAEKIELVVSGSSGIPRLGIPPLAFVDGPNGIGEGSTHVTAFPDAETIAASWDSSVAARYGDALGAEAASKGDTLLAAPTINIVRTPKWGREAETLGEDPFLTSTLVAPEIRAIQRHHVIAEVKHYAAYNQEIGRLGNPLATPAVNDQVSQRALQEIYFPGFHSAVAGGHAASVMCSYNQINDLPSCQNPATLGTLRGLGLTGFVEPDALLAVRDEVAAANAGVDNFQLGSLTTAAGGSELPIITAAVSSGRISPQRLNAMVMHVLESMFAVGRFDHPGHGSAGATATTPAHRSLATRVAEQATVLLRNRGGVLPLTPATRSIAVIGHDAGPGTQIEENGSPAVAHGPVITPIAAIRARAGGTTGVSYTPGTLGVVPLAPIAPRVLSAGADHGWRAAYYTSSDLTGPTLLTRAVPSVDFHSVIKPLSPIPDTGGAHSARFTATLTPPRTGRYRFSLAAAGIVRLYVGGRLVVSGNCEFSRADRGLGGLTADPGGPIIALQGVTELKAGRPVPIELTYSTGSSIVGASLGLGWQPPAPGLVTAAVRAARRAHVAVVFANDITSEGMDRPSLALPGDQDQLIEAVARANPRTVVVLHTAGPVLMPWLSKVAGVLEAWYPGQQSGAAIAATLFGDVDTAGRLPVTFPVSEREGPATAPAQYPGLGGKVRYDEGIFVGYRFYDRFGQRPLFPFGYGLSYTTFALGSLHVHPLGSMNYDISLRVTNTGARTGAEVVQLYLGDPPAAGEPPRQLKGFVKLWLHARGAATVHLRLDRQSFSVWRSSSRSFAALPGRYVVSVGTSSRDLPRRAAITIR